MGNELNEYNRKVADEVFKQHEEYCHPKWIEGYCGESKEAPRHTECTLPTGQNCKRGIVLPNSEQDELANWEEAFKEKPVEVKFAPIPPPPVLGLPPLPEQSAEKSCTSRSRFNDAL